MSKCPFCAIPCNNDHCPYDKEAESTEKEDSKEDCEDCDTKIRGFEEENKRLRQMIREMTYSMRNPKT